MIRVCLPEKLFVVLDDFSLSLLQQVAQLLITLAYQEIQSQNVCNHK